MGSSYDWTLAARSYLERLGFAEYKAQFRAECKATGKKKPRKKWRYSPSSYHRDLVKFLNDNDELGFKSRKCLEGYNSAIGI